MTREIGKLSAAQINLLGPGLHSDGGGLYLNISTTGARSWIFRYMLNGRAREMGLGPTHTIRLAEARKRAAQCRRQRLNGVDPIDNRRARRTVASPGAATAITFKGPSRPTPAPPQQFPNRIADMRRSRGFSMDQLGTRAVPPTTGSVINKLEKGQRRLTLHWMQRLAAALECEPGQLLPGTQDTLSNEELSLVYRYRRLPDGDRRTLDRVLDALARTTGGPLA